MWKCGNTAGDMKMWQHCWLYDNMTTVLVIWQYDNSTGDTTIWQQYWWYDNVTTVLVIWQCDNGVGDMTMWHHCCLYSFNALKSAAVAEIRSCTYTANCNIRSCTHTANCNIRSCTYTANCNITTIQPNKLFSLFGWTQQRISTRTGEKITYKGASNVYYALDVIKMVEEWRGGLWLGQEMCLLLLAILT